MDFALGLHGKHSALNHQGLAEIDAANNKSPVRQRPPDILGSPKKIDSPHLSPTRSKSRIPRPEPRRKPSDKSETFERGGQESLQDVAKAILGPRSLREAVKLPQGENRNDWIGAHVLMLCKQLEIIFSCVEETCEKKCLNMSINTGTLCSWRNPLEHDEPMKSVSAAQYMRNCFEFCHTLAKNPNFYPKEDDGFDSEEQASLGNLWNQIFIRFFRIYCHLYNFHINYLMATDIVRELNTSFRQFYYFIHEFNLRIRDFDTYKSSLPKYLFNENSSADARENETEKVDRNPS